MSKELQKRLMRIESAVRHSVGMIRIEAAPHETNAEAVRRVFGDAGAPKGVPLAFFEREPTSEEWEAAANGEAARQSLELQQDRASRFAFVHVPGPCRVIRLERGAAA